MATWEKLTDIHIDHFMMVDFAGVVSMADAIGGVPVCVDANIYSHTSAGKGSGLKLKKGTTSVKGQQALQWLRTRYGFEDDTDIARTKAQHQYMNSMVRQLRENATLSNPTKLRSLAETATKAITVDDGLGTVAKLYDLSKELKKVPTNRITMTTMPWEYSGNSGRVVPRPDDAQQLFRLVREDIALDGKDKKKAATANASTDPAAADDKIAVQVENGTRTDSTGAVRGRATSVADLLVGKGFKEAVADSSTTPSEAKTVIRYPSADLEGDAQRVAKALGIPDERGEEVHERLGDHPGRRRGLDQRHEVQGRGGGRQDPDVGGRPQRLGHHGLHARRPELRLVVRVVVCGGARLSCCWTG